MTAAPPEVLLRPAVRADAAAIAQLLVARGLPTAGALAHVERFILAFHRQTLVGCAGVEQYGDVGLLRSVAVAETWGGQGLGAQLVGRAVQLARERGIRSLFLLTTTAADYFPRFGFEPVSREALPASLAESEELRGACPASATAMRLLLPAR